MQLTTANLAARDASGPTITPYGAGNLWNQTAPNEWVWNPPGDSWPIGFTASDPTGVCELILAVSGSVFVDPNTPYNSTQCPPTQTWTAGEGATVDTRTFVVGGGSMQLSLGATDPAHLATSEIESVQVDNAPVRVSLRIVNDPNPAAWVDHAVTVVATPIAGPSGVTQTDCQVDGGGAEPYPRQGMTLNGDGVHTVSCTAWNNAVDPQGLHAEGTGSIAVYIDEVPPSIRFEPRTARDPTALVVDGTDNQSGIAGGSMELAPAGTNDWVPLPTSFDGRFLTTHLDDHARRGAYVLRATACDNAGNCSSAAEAITLPLRAAPNFEVSLTKIAYPGRRHIVYKKVLVGWHWGVVRRHGHVVRVKRGGHLATIRVHVTVQQCTTSPPRHRLHIPRHCHTLRPHLTTTLTIPHGRSITIHGVFTTAAGVPLVGQPVDILAALDNHMDTFHAVTVATTTHDGRWTATLPAGPSRVIRAVTDGTATILPSSREVTALVPADIRLLDVWPRHVSWGGTVHLVGQLRGGYLPPGGALVRLRIGYGSVYNTYGVQEHVTGNGRFSTVATFGPGNPSIRRTYWFQIASLPMGDYPYAPGASERVPVIVGG